MKFVNLTPHEIVVRPDGVDAAEIRIPPSGTVARVETSSKDCGYLVEEDNQRVPLVKVSYGEVSGFAPTDPKDGAKCYIVSSIVAQALAQAGERSIVVAPDTGPESAIRDDAGRIISVRRFLAF